MRIKFGLIAGLLLLNILTLADAAIVSIDSVRAPPDGTVVVPIMINNVTDAGSIQITLKYDKNVAHITNVIAGNFDSTIQNISNTTGITTIAAFQITNLGLNGNVRLANITLMAVGSERASTPLNITITILKTAMPPLQNIIATTVNGTFTIASNTSTGSSGMSGTANREEPKVTPGTAAQSAKISQEPAEAQKTPERKEEKVEIPKEIPRAPFISSIILMLALLLLSIKFKLKK